MRRLLIAASVAAALVVLTACGGGGSSTGGSSQPSGVGASTPSAALAAKTVEAGAVTVKVDPVRIDAGGAEFKVSFDTHSVALDLDVARNATLTVADVAWTGAAWAGDGPGGHHREGTLRFSAAGPAEKSAVLDLTGLPGPVTATWALGG